MPAENLANSVVLNLEPSSEFPRNSEGSMATLKSGRIICIYTQFYGGRRDHSAARIVEIHSDDQGRTWSSPPRVVVEKGEAQNVMSASLLRLNSGNLAMFYLVKAGHHDCRPWMKI